MTYVTIPISSNYPILSVIKAIVENYHLIIKYFVSVKDFRLKAIIFNLLRFNLFIEVNCIVFQRHLKLVRFVVTFIVSIPPTIFNFAVSRLIVSK